MIRLIVLIGALAWIGMALLLTELRWFRRVPLRDRLGPYTPGSAYWNPGHTPFSIATFQDVIAPLAHTTGEIITKLFGLDADLATRLERLHDTETVAQFRTRQVACSVAAFVVSAGLAALVGAPLAFTIFLIAAGPVVTFLVFEQSVTRRGQLRQDLVRDELPVIAEQLAMLLGAGYSLGSALVRLAQRGNGAVSQDLGRVVSRIRQGLAEEAALAEWAEVAGLVPVTRLVSVLSLNRDGADLGRLIGDEAKAIRREANRRQIERIERRNQQVWIPVTVAALVPGIVLLAVPFIDALSSFAGR